VEDAVFADLDGDGALDVVSSCEGGVRAMYVHWGPSDSARILESAAWKTELLPVSSTDVMWMFCLPMDVDGKRGIDLIAGGKGAGAEVGWFEAPEDPRDLAAWRWHPLYEAGWIMSLIAADMDGDGDEDVLVTDRKGAGSGVLWIEHVDTPGDWPIHRIGCEGQEVMFAAVGDLDGDGLDDVLTLVKPNVIVWLRRAADGWERHDIAMSESAARAKAVNIADIDLDGRMDLVFTCESADAPKSGCMWMSCDGSPLQGGWTAHDVSGPEGVKYDLIEPIDMDADGDLDLLTCEERDNLGVFWYENPAISMD